MIHKLGHVKDLETIVIEDTALRSAIKNYLYVLDNAYGEGRNIDSDLGGYVLYGDNDTRFEDLKEFFDCTDIPHEWVNEIDSDPQYVGVLYILSSDYAVVVVIPEEAYLKENENVN